MRPLGSVRYIYTRKKPSIKFPSFEFVDSNGVLVKVRKLVLEVLKNAMRRGFIVSTLSWNDPAKALRALRALDPGKLLRFSRYRRSSE
jgi:predicted phosphatase